MNDIDNDFIASFDIDGTLVKPVDSSWDLNNPNFDKKNYVHITDPYTGKVKLREILWPNIELMKSYKARGYYIVAWSHGGKRWARSVVNALGLQEIVNHAQAKPSKIVDDLPIEKGLCPTIFVKED